MARSDSNRFPILQNDFINDSDNDDQKALSSVNTNVCLQMHLFLDCLILSFVSKGKVELISQIKLFPFT